MNNVITRLVNFITIIRTAWIVKSTIFERVSIKAKRILIERLQRFWERIKYLHKHVCSGCDCRFPSILRMDLKKKKKNREAQYRLIVRHNAGPMLSRLLWTDRAEECYIDLRRWDGAASVTRRTPAGREPQNDPVDDEEFWINSCGPPTADHH